MSHFHRIRKILALPLIMSLLISTFPVTGFSAENVSTDQLLEQSMLQSDREMIRDLVSREDMRDQMQLLGVDPGEAMDRVNSMSDDEVRQIAGEIKTMPAGGDGLGTIVGAAVTIFIILLITDILCLTSFFNFTKCVR